MRVKVCGIGQLEQVPGLVDAGASFAGFIFYPKSPRYVLRHNTTAQLKKERSINKVGVFVNAQADELLTMVDECGLHMVQLHGDETPRYCEKIANYISVIKAFRLTDTSNIEWMVRDYAEVCDMYLFDTEGAGYGGTGKKFNWELLKTARLNKPFFLSGGIEPGDAAGIKAFAKEPVATNLFALDINSKFEILPGVKDLEKVKQFISGVQ